MRNKITIFSLFSLYYNYRLTIGKQDSEFCLQVEFMVVILGVRANIITMLDTPLLSSPHVSINSSKREKIGVVASLHYLSIL